MEYNKKKSNKDRPLAYCKNKHIISKLQAYPHDDARKARDHKAVSEVQSENDHYNETQPENNIPTIIEK